MSDVALRLEHVYKKFRKGEVYDSLRDLIPALTGRMFRQQDLNSSDKREFWALEDVSFEVKRGEAFGIIGPNGAGKSTMLKLLGRVMKPTRGSFYLPGRCSALIELGAGFHQDLTGRENAFLYGAILGMKRREIAAKFDEIVEFSGLAEFIDTPVKRYSSGMYARLGFAIASHVNPDVLLVDEVLSVGDTLFQRKCVEHMRAVIRDGATVLFVSHSLKTVADFCSRTLLLDHGREVTIGPTPTVISQYMSLQREHRAAEQNRAVVISKVSVRDATGPCHRFQSGQKAWIDIEVAAHEPCSKLAVVLYLRDESYYTLFVTSTERLGHGSVSLDPGDILKCTYEVQLNLGSGVFYPSVNLFRYDNQQWYDSWEAAETIYVWSQEDFTGPVNCFPKVVHQEVRRGELREPQSHTQDEPETQQELNSTPNVPARVNTRS
jgi:ABC-type polysaccharide/polyol phosphate transport system ATPase subunit